MMETTMMKKEDNKKKQEVRTRRRASVTDDFNDSISRYTARQLSRTRLDATKKKQKNNRYKFIRWKKEPATTGYYLMKPDKTRYARSNSWKTSAYSVNLIETCKSSFSVDETRCSILENRVKPGRIRRNGETRSNRVVKVVFFFKRIEKMARARARW